MTIFISHAVVDREMVLELLKLLQLGIGVPHAEIFCSSEKASIPNGEYFVQHILKHLEAADFIVSVVSRSYLKSEFCLEELGAARMRHSNGTAKSLSLIVPPVGYSELQGVLYGVQSGEITEASVLDGLRDDVTKRLGSPQSTAVWNNARDGFLDTVKRLVNRQRAVELLKKLTLQDVFYEPNAAPTITYKSKIRIVLRNETEHDLYVRDCFWNSIPDVPIYLPRGAGFEAEGNDGWEQDSWVEGGASVHVPAGRAMRAWVGFARSFTNDEFRRRHETRRLGTLVLPIRFDGYEEVPLETPL